MTDNRLTPERMEKLIDKFWNLGLKVKLKAAIDNTLRIQLGSEDFKLEPELQNRAFELTSDEISTRVAVEFAEELLKQIKAVVESDGPGERPEKSDGHRDNKNGKTGKNGDDRPVG